MLNVLLVKKNGLEGGVVVWCWSRQWPATATTTNTRSREKVKQMLQSPPFFHRSTLSLTHNQIYIYIYRFKNPNSNQIEKKQHKKLGFW